MNDLIPLLVVLSPIGLLALLMVLALRRLYGSTSRQNPAHFGGFFSNFDGYPRTAMHIRVPTPFWKRLWYVVSNPVRYLFWGELRL